jgi:hypothetical protein
MTRKTRNFLLGSAGILTVGLCTGLVAYYGGFPSGAFSQAEGPQEIRYVPADATVLAYANVRDVMTSDFRQRLRAAMPEERGQQEFEQQTGINIETDVDSVVACMLPVEAQRPGGGLALIRGRFNDVRIEAFAREHGGQVEEYRGKRVIEAPGPGGGDIHGHGERPVLAFLEPGLLAVGERHAVRRAIDTLETGQSVRSNDELMRLVGEVEIGSSAWVVGRFDVLASRANLPDGVANQIPPIKWFAGTGRLNGGLSGSLRAEAGDDQSAQNLRDVVRGFLALAKLQAGSRPEFQPILQSLELGGSGRTVALSFSIPTQVIDLVVPKHRPEAP